MAGQEISYLDAWSAWADGVDIRNRVLWGLEIYWWARWAKVGAFIAGLTLLLDIVGPERIERYLRQHQPETGRLQDVRNPYRVIRKPPPTPGHEEASPPPKPAPLVRRIGYMLTILTVAVSLVGISIFRGATFVVVFPAIAFIGSLIGWERLNIVAWWIAKSIAWVFNHARLLRVLRAISFALLIVAFHFDFLAS
ncbi:hypothetical protein [Nonomuraea bangladeshensis]|uniref:hypothetical protein n=1 Tax=Nonomuraea bangladeshensis TaxID=404385 RepID=UPI003C2FCC32